MLLKAVVCTEFGPPDVLQIKVLEKPTPKDNEILIRVYATTVNYGDIIARDFRNITPRKFNMPFLFWFLALIDFGLRKPRKIILGSEFAGEIEAVSKDVERFRKGDPVFGHRGQRIGAYAEYLCVPEDGMVAKKSVNEFRFPSWSPLEPLLFQQPELCRDTAKSVLRCACYRMNFSPLIIVYRVRNNRL